MDRVIEVKDLCVVYPDGRQALSEVSLDVEEGDSVALLGANGAGKSTLLLSLVGVVKAEGTIRVCGMELTENTLLKIRRIAQLVFQDPNDQLFMPVLRDDVAFGPRNFGVTRERACELVCDSLNSVGLPGFEDRVPHNMSFGERKRAALATVLACSPEILLLDEPGAGLDPRGRRELSDLLDNLECTKIIATHDLDFARRTCRTAFVLHEGRLTAAGITEEIVADDNLLQECGLV